MSIHASREPWDSKARDPEPYSDQPNLWGALKQKTSTVFQLKSVSFTSDISKIQFICDLLRESSGEGGGKVYSLPS